MASLWFSPVAPKMLRPREPGLIRAGTIAVDGAHGVGDQMGKGLLRIGFGVCAAAAVLAVASAQTTAAKKPAASETVTVKAARLAVQVLPDRTVYTLDKNIQGATGTLSDVLRDIPSVDVDADGNLKLRGDSNVTVLIDGKKSPLLSGNLADALQQIPAGMVERIEVVTNPSAEFRAEGSGGVVNIVLRKDKEQKASGIVRLTIGNEGRLNGGVSGNIKLGRVMLNGAYGELRAGQRSRSATVRTDGATLRSSQDVSALSKFSGRYIWLAATRDPGSTDEVTLGGTYARFAGHADGLADNVAPAADIMETILARWQRESAGGQFAYTHRFATKGKQISLELSRFTSWGRNSTDFTDTPTATGVSGYWQSRWAVTRDVHSELKSDYVLPLDGKDVLKLGYDLQNDTSLTDNHGQWRDTTTAGWIPNSLFINKFVLDRTIQAAYATYERHFGKLGVIGGLRMEQDFLSTDLRTTGESHDSQTLGFYPSLHLSYGLTDTQQLNLSYSRRMNRPGTYALNPARYSNDSFNVWAGNPDLKPEQVDSFEASYRDVGESFDLVVTGYYRATYKGITNVYRYLSPTVLLTTMDNLAHRKAGGVETTLNLRLPHGLTARTTGTIAYDEFNPGPTGIGLKQSGLNWNVKGGIDWQATPDDFVQFNIHAFSKQRFAQGYSKPSMGGNIGYKHTFDGGLAAVASVNNLFNSWGGTMVLDAPGLHQVSHNATLGRVYTIGLVYTFGGARDTQPISGDTSPSPGGPPGGP